MDIFTAGDKLFQNYFKGPFERRAVASQGTQACKEGSLAIASMEYTEQIRLRS